MNPLVLGWALIVVGVIAIVLGLAGGIAKMFKDIQAKSSNAANFAVIALPTELIKALTALINALVKAPAWLAIVIIGILLVAWGTMMV